VHFAKQNASDIEPLLDAEAVAETGDAVSWILQFSRFTIAICCTVPSRK